MIYQIIEKVFIIYILALIIKGLNMTGFIDWIIRPVNRIKNIKHIFLFWFLIGAVVSSVFTDLTTALILLPIQILYMEKANIAKNKELLLITLCFGIMAGGDLTMFGGGDNLVAVGLYKEFYDSDFTNLMWVKYMLPVTLLSMTVTFAAIYPFIKNEHTTYVKEETRSKIKKYPTFILLYSIVCVFLKYYIPAYLLVFVAYLDMKKPKEMFENIPYKPMAIWTFAFLFGKFVGSMILNHVDISVLNEINSNYIFAVLCGITILTTIFCTNTATASAVMGIYMSLFPASPLMFVILLKCINVGYLTIYHNTCLVVGNGYGITQKSLLKVGFAVTILQIMVIAAYVGFLR